MRGGGGGEYVRAHARVCVGVCVRHLYELALAFACVQRSVCMSVCLRVCVVFQYVCVNVCLFFFWWLGGRRNTPLPFTLRSLNHPDKQDVPSCSGGQGYVLAALPIC